MAIDWKTIISEFDGKPTLLQAIGKLRKAVEDETITIQQAQAEIAKLESQQKADEALITTADTKAQNAQSAAQAADTKAQQALDLAQTNEQDIAKLEQNKVDKIKSTSEYVRIYGVSKDGQETTYELSEEVVPWKIVRRNQKGNIKSNSAIENNDVVINKDFRSELYKKQDKITDTTNLEARYISAVSAFRKVTLVGSTKTYDDIYFEKGRETGDIYVLTRGNTKTLFGNKSLYGTGNIDLYRHEISYGAINDGITITVNFEHYSSNNLKADSIADVKTLLGNTFKKGIFGSITNTATGKALVPLYINETNIFYIGEDGSVQNQTLSGTFTDTVTAI